MNKKQLAELALELRSRINDAIRVLKLDEKESEFDLMESETQATDFWQDRDNSKGILQKMNGLKALIQPWRQMEQEVQDLVTLLDPLGEQDEMLGSIEEDLQKVNRELAEHENETYLNGKYDNENALLSVFAGAGGVDAQDWTEMLLGMFLKYAETKKLQTQIISLSEGTEAGIKSVTIEITGTNAYGLLKSEGGVHRLVRISPYDADKARHTSFALVEVIPALANNNEEIPETELKIDTYRASGHGGQSVNTTDSAVRVTHLPSGIVVTCQNERSQLQNKESAMRILRSRLAASREAEREAELKVIKGDNLSAEWGSQIRSYVLHPYQMVKDHRTGTETSDTKGVLEGNLDSFVEAYLKNK
jgi:peptide chain release factor 2